MVADGIGHPDRDRLAGVVFHDEERTFFLHIGPELLDERGFVFYIVQGIGHENAIEERKGERVFYKVGPDGNDGCRPVGGWGLPADSRICIDAIDGAAGG